MKFFTNKYRVVTDRYAGYEVQIKYWWFPIWMELGINTHHNIEDALELVEHHKYKKHIVVPDVDEYLHEKKA